MSFLTCGILLIEIRGFACSILQHSTFKTKVKNGLEKPSRGRAKFLYSGCMISFLREIAFVRIIIPFAAGIAGYALRFYPVSIWLVFYSLILASALFVILNYYRPLRNSIRLRWVSGILVSLIFFLAGYIVCFSKTEINHGHHFSGFTTHASKVLLQLSEPLSEKNKSYKTLAKVKLIAFQDTLLPVTGTVIVYFRKDSLSKQLQYGDRIWVTNRFSALPSPKNPHEFNYKRFMTFRQVHHQIFLRSEDWLLSETKGGQAWYAAILSLRQYLIEVLGQHIRNADALAVASSLILGMREKLDDELIRAYSSSGAMHVLAVSGLHVGIIYTLISWLLKFLDHYKKSRVVKSTLIIMVIWLYALVTGLSPSVMRASMMFTLVAVGKNMLRITNIYNILAGSAFILLLYNPYFIMEVGFQLSYLAVLGIVLLHPRIYPLLYLPNWLADKIWMLTSVSVAAQIATFPLGLLYYYQFPVYFLVSNLFVIPLSTLILFLGVALFCLHWLPYAGEITGWLLNLSLEGMNAVVRYIDSLPYSLLQGIAIGIAETWIIYLIIACIIIFFYFHRTEFLLASLSMLTLLLVINTAGQWRALQQSKLVVYSIPRTTAIDFISGNRHFFIADSSLLRDKERMLFHVKHNWWNNRLRLPVTSFSDNQSRSFLKKHENYLLFHHTRILVIDDTYQLPDSKGRLLLDYIILTKDPNVHIRDLSEKFSFQVLIFDGSNSRRKVRLWLRQCEALGIPCYDVASKGAFIALI
ncbi:MAG: competence protein [Chitinophagales bacterium]|nr:MAG: competence protein [Chitinophagales bacterium]